MREWCSCGAAIRGRRRDVLTWRTQHSCPDKPDQPMVPPTGATSQVETNPQQVWFEDSIGFRPNP